MSERGGATPERVLYGRRRGRRLRSGRQALLDGALDRFRLQLPPEGRLSGEALFGARRDDLWLEIGFGNGEHLADVAAAHPGVGCLGCEPFMNGVSMLLQHLTRRGIGNVRIHTDDARELLAALPDACLGRVYLLFPDPWPKARHYRRRFLSPASLEALSRTMRPGAELRLATDHMELGRWMLRQALSHPDFEWLAEGPSDWRGRAADEPATRYEGKALAAGRPCLYLRFRRRA